MRRKDNARGVGLPLVAGVAAVCLLIGYMAGQIGESGAEVVFECPRQDAFPGVRYQGNAWAELHPNERALYECWHDYDDQGRLTE